MVYQNRSRAELRRADYKFTIIIISTTINLPTVVEADDVKNDDESGAPERERERVNGELIEPAVW